MFNKDKFLKDFSDRRKNASSIPKYTIENMIDEYMESLDDQMEMEKRYNECATK